MSNTIHFLFVPFLLLFCSIRTICAAPNCTREDEPLRNGNTTVCRSVIGINTSAIDQALINAAADPSGIGHVHILGWKVHLSESTLKPFRNMHVFKISGRYNSINGRDFTKSTIESNAFIENKQLTDLSSTFINFASLENLRSVFRPLFGQLTSMDLYHCSFSQIPSTNATTTSTSYDPFQVFREFTKLEYFLIIHDGLTTIPADAFQKSANTLYRIEIQNNKITTIDRNAFKNLGALVRLDLHDNEIASIESGMFDDLISLKFLYLHNNRISQLPNILFGKSGNKLIRLNLSNNNLTMIHPTTFKGLTELKSLDLANNEITSMEPGTLDDLISLQEINLNRNRISQLPRNLFEKTALIRFNIENNPTQNFTGAGNADRRLYVDVSE